MKRLLILIPFVLFANDYDRFLEQFYTKKEINKTLLKKLEKKYPKAYAVEDVLKNEDKLKSKCLEEANKSACKILADALDFIKIQDDLTTYIILSGVFDGYDVKDKLERSLVSFVKAIVNDNEKAFKQAINEVVKNSFFINGNDLITLIGALKNYYPNLKVDKYKKLTKNILEKKKIFTIYKLYNEYQKTKSFLILQKLLTYPQNTTQKNYLTKLLAEHYIKDNPKKALEILNKLPDDKIKKLFLAESYINLREYNKAIKLLKSLPQKGRVLRDLMIGYYKLKDYNTAFEYAKKLLPYDKKTILEFAYKTKKQDIYIKTLKLLGLYEKLLKRKKLNYLGYQFEIENQKIIMKGIKND